MLGENVKVHFAGSDGEVIFNAALCAADIKYRLFSCYKYIYGKTDESLKLPEEHTIKEQDRANKHVIQDSGLFTLMFGAGKEINVNREYLIQWQDRLMRFVTENNLNCTCVEVDCQKILGVDDAWFLRKRMKELLPNRQINVFHYEDGKDGLDHLIDFSDYIAISVPELRIVKPRTYKKYTSQLARYIKKKKPSIDIHLLGCTEFGLLAENSFCTTADSTSWLAGVKYGFFDDGIKKSHIRNFRKDIFEERKKQIENYLTARNTPLKEKTLEYSTRASLCASICKKKYTDTAGNQD